MKNPFMAIKVWWTRHQLDSMEYKRLKNLKQMKQYALMREKYDDILMDEYQRQKFLNQLHDIKKTTYTKKMVTWILAICIIDIQAAFVLAIFDKGAHLEGIVNNLTNTILGVSFIYMIRAYFDSRAEHKNMDEARMASIKNGLTGKISSILQSAGISDITAEQFLASADENDKSSRKFHIDINGVNISAGRETKPKLNLDKLKSLSRRPPNTSNTTNSGNSSH